MSRHAAAKLLIRVSIDVRISTCTAAWREFFSDFYSALSNTFTTLFKPLLELPTNC